tara:strand:- start:562 stop:1044 length:483 start_codon:yes stop_codon:yes gene_type:complete
MAWDYDFWIDGQCPSAKNQRQLVGRPGSRRLIKSAKALAYSKSFAEQCAPIDELITGDVALWVDSYYSSRRPDLACVDFIQDLLQGKIYLNDRQVKASGSTWNLDKENPRVRIRIRSIASKGCTEMSSLDVSKIWGVEIKTKQDQLSDGPNRILSQLSAI